MGARPRGETPKNPKKFGRSRRYEEYGTRRQVQVLGGPTHFTDRKFKLLLPIRYSCLITETGSSFPTKLQPR